MLKLGFLGFRDSVASSGQTGHPRQFSVPGPHRPLQDRGVLKPDELDEHAEVPAPLDLKGFSGLNKVARSKRPSGGFHQWGYSKMVGLQRKIP